MDDDYELVVTMSGKQSAQIIAALCMAAMNGIFPRDEVWEMIDKLVGPPPDQPISLYPRVVKDDLDGD